MLYLSGIKGFKYPIKILTGFNRKRKITEFRRNKYIQLNDKIIKIIECNYNKKLNVFGLAKVYFYGYKQFRNNTSDKEANKLANLLEYYIQEDWFEII